MQPGDDFAVGDAGLCTGAAVLLVIPRRETEARLTIIIVLLLIMAPILQVMKLRLRATCWEVGGGEGRGEWGFILLPAVGFGLLPSSGLSVPLPKYASKSYLPVLGIATLFANRVFAGVIR